MKDGDIVYIHHLMTGEFLRASNGIDVMGTIFSEATKWKVSSSLCPETSWTTFESERMPGQFMDYIPYARYPISIRSPPDRSQNLWFLHSVDNPGADIVSDLWRKRSLER